MAESCLQSLREEVESKSGKGMHHSHPGEGDPLPSDKTLTKKFSESWHFVRLKDPSTLHNMT